MKKYYLPFATLAGAGLIISVFFQNCGYASLSMEVPVSSTSVESEKIDFSSFQFLNGGGYPAPNTPLYSDDIKFAGKDGELVAHSNTSDASCSKPEKILSESDRAQILEHIANLKVAAGKDLPVVADAPSEKIIMTLKDGSEKVIFLTSSGAQSGDLIASNGADLAALLKSINKTIPVACQLPEVLQKISSIQYNSFGGYPAPGRPTPVHDMKFTLSNGVVKVKAEVQDTACFKPEATLSKEDIQKIKTLLEKMESKVKEPGAEVADAVTAKITVSLLSGESKVVHLTEQSAKAGELYTPQGNDLITFLHDLEQSLPMACQ
jgi:hypothetical protein